jgi:hypothetical protein
MFLPLFDLLLQHQAEQAGPATQSLSSSVHSRLLELPAGEET